MIRFEQVTKYFGERKVLDGHDFTIEEGETFVIVGFSGAGKSVTLKHMIRLLTPDEGRVLVGGEAISEAGGRDLERLRRQFGFLFQGAALLEWLTVLENVALPLREKTDWPDDRILALAREKLKLVGLEHASNQHPAELSGGMRKRVGLARAIVGEPRIILYDEPTSGLDPISTSKVEHSLLALKEDYTIIIVPHNIQQAARLADYAAFFLMGELIEYRPGKELFTTPRDRRTEDYITGRFG